MYIEEKLTSRKGEDKEKLTRQISAFAGIDFRKPNTEYAEISTSLKNAAIPFITRLNEIQGDLTSR